MRTEDNKRPTLVEPDSDDDTMPPRKRQKSERLPVSAGSGGLALLQTAFEIVLAAEKKAFALSVKAASSRSTADRSSVLWGICPSLLPRGDVWPDHVSTPRPSRIMTASSASAASAASIMSRRAATNQDIEMLLSLAVLNKRRSQQVVGTTNNDLPTSPTKARAGPPPAATPPLPCGRPLLAPPRLPHLKLGLIARKKHDE